MESLVIDLPIFAPTVENVTDFVQRLDTLHFISHSRRERDRNRRDGPRSSFLWTRNEGQKQFSNYT